MTAPEPRQVNIPLLRKAVEWAEAEAAKPFALCEWEQAWVETTPAEFARLYGEGAKSPECGTCYCIAGYVASQEGVTKHKWDYAQEALGLSARQAWDLFAASNTIEDVRRIAEYIAGERL